jgi:NAD(P)-dependent dehydrogenase (short-subunit alcohol dehydrogenase family)
VTKANTSNGSDALAGKVAMVTGSTKGLGRAIISGLAAAGAAVVVTSRKQELCEKVAAEVRAETGATVIARACNVGDWDESATFVDYVVGELGGIDILVNNAGIMPRRQEVADIEKSYWRKVLSVNLEGPLRMSQLVAPVMRNGGGGSIINLSSIAAYHAAAPGLAAYSVSKAAVLALTRNMASEWADWGIRVNAISPGPMRSNLGDASELAEPGYYKRSGSATLMGRVGETEEIVGPVLYFAGHASSYVTGEDHIVGGGSFR